MKGTVKWFDNQKKFGFIKPETGNGDIFVHISELEKSGLKTLNENQEVTFEVSTEKGRSSAKNIQIA